MKRLRRHRDRGLTLIEVMVSMLIIMIIVIGVIGYMYGCMWNARRAEVRITAARIGQLLLETWKITGHNIYNDEGDVIGWSWNVDDFDPTDPGFNSTLPDNFTDDDFDLTGNGIVGIELDDYEITIDDVVYFVTLLFDNNQPQMLSARVAWNQNLGSTTLDTNYRYVDVTSYAIY